MLIERETKLNVIPTMLTYFYNVVDSLRDIRMNKEQI